MSYEEEDTCMAYEEEDTSTCDAHHVLRCMSYEQEDTCMAYEEEDTSTCVRIPRAHRHTHALEAGLGVCGRRTWAPMKLNLRVRSQI